MTTVSAIRAGLAALTTGAAPNNPRLTRRERRLWDAVYGAAFVAEFKRDSVAGNGYALDLGVRQDEEAKALADHAIESRRAWKD